METDYQYIIAPARINKPKMNKTRIACLVFLGLFLLGTSVYFGYWYATDWQDMKNSPNLLTNPIPQSIINNTFCPLNFSEFTQNSKPKGL